VSRLTGSGLNLLLGLANAALVPVVAFYLMRDWDDIAARITAPAAARLAVGHAAYGARGGRGCRCLPARAVHRHVRPGVVCTLGLWIVGVQLALLLGVIAGLASIVPYLGFIVGIVSSLIAAYLQFGEWLPLLWVAAVFGVGQLIESMVLTPVLVGDRIGLHPVAVIFALMAGGQLAGFVGVLLALPAAAVIMVFARHAVAHYQESGLYGRE
jgi:predicted PurR-regulated permease PerM